MYRHVGRASVVVHSHALRARPPRSSRWPGAPIRHGTTMSPRHSIDAATLIIFHRQ